MTKLTNILPAHVADNQGEPPAAQMLAFSELTPIDRDKGTSALLNNVNPLHQIKTRLTVVVGEVELTVGELLAAHEHQVIRLDRTIEQPVDLLLEGRVVARGQLVAVDEHFAIKITELPTPLKV